MTQVARDRLDSTGGIGGILERRAGLPASSPAALAEEFGTPFYVYDLDLIGRRVEALRAVLPRGFRVAFAVKANPALAVVAHLRRCGVGADIASGGELETVLRAGFDPASVAMTGPGQARRRAGGRGGRRHRHRHGRVARASCAGWRRSPPGSAAASRSCCAWPSPRTRASRPSA